MLRNILGGAPACKNVTGLYILGGAPVFMCVQEIVKS